MPQQTQISVSWPSWVEQHRIDDALTAAAYENAGPAARAALKTAMAMYFRYDDSTREIIHEYRSDHMSGFWRSRTVFPAPWAIVAVTPRYVAAARVLAALMPASSRLKEVSESSVLLSSYISMSSRANSM